jgi:RNA polymerase sigma factor (sigma-70 family)
MTTVAVTNLLRRLRRMTAGPADARRPDHELVERFLARREQDAFAELVRRHGPMVLNLCRSVLRHEQDAEDAFQATFLVLAKKAGSIRRPGAVAGWLHEVAYHLALKARTEGRRPAPLPPDEAMPTSDPLLDMTLGELRAVLHEELRQLPAHYQAPLVLCYLEGKTQEEAARQLGWSRGTVRGRVNRGRERLRSRLVRRGLALPAGGLATVLAQSALGAPVPAALAAAAVRGGVLLAAGKPAAAAVSADVLCLAQAAVRAMTLSKVKLATAVFLAAGVFGLAALAHQVTTEEPSAAEPSGPGDQEAARPARGAQPSAKQRAARPDAAERVTVTGRVLDAAGKPVALAHVAVVARLQSPDRIQVQRAAGTRLLAQGKADAKGAFQLRLSRLAPKRYWAACALASWPGHGLGHRALKFSARRKAGDVRLPAEWPLRGRLFGLQGKPAAGVRVGAVRLFGFGASRTDYLAVDVQELPAGSPFRPTPALSDRQGRFTLRGLGPELWVTIEATGAGFARQQFEIKPEDRKKGKEFRFSLAPARVLEGTVTLADTLRPVPGARLRILARRSRRRPGDAGGTGAIGLRADAQGRFRAVPHTGSHFTLIAFPPRGTAYLPVQREIDWPPADVVKRDINLALPRGILVRGTVAEKSSGKPVAGAAVHFTPNRDNNPYFREYFHSFSGEGKACLSGPDGKFALAVLPGPGHLLIDGPTPSYLRSMIGTKELYSVRVGPNRRHYVDGLVPLNLKPQSGPREVRVILRRGATVQGRVLDPDGKPVARAELVSLAYLAYGTTFNGKQAKEVRDGRFQLAGCDADKAVEVFFYDAKGPSGAVLELSAKKPAGRPVTVRLRPCGTATARFVEASGKPLAGVGVVAEFVLTPGLCWADGFTRKGLLADVAFMSNLDPQRHNNLVTDARGRVTVPGLIPGATYRLIVQRPSGPVYHFYKKVKVKAGQTLPLGDVRVLESR